MKRIQKEPGMILFLMLIALFTIILSDGHIVHAEGWETSIVTRGEWIHNLTSEFDMTLDKLNFPDDYYVDVKEGEPYYDDIMLAVGYGVINLEAGKSFEPDKAVTREFAAHTLNFCLGYRLDEASQYTFSDYSDCVYPEDDQIAVNRGWINLVNGKFNPQEPLTYSESTYMMKDANEILAAAVVDNEHENKWDVKSDVIIVPQYSEVCSDSDTVTIMNCPVTIHDGDKFAIYQGDILVPYKAVSVSVANGTTIISVETIEFDEAFTTVEAEGIIDSDDLVFEPAEGVELTDLEDGTATFSSRASNKISNKKFKKDIKLSNGVTVSVEGTIKNIVAEYKLFSGDGTVHAKLSADISVTDKIKVASASLGNASFEICKVGIPGVGGLTVNVDVKAAGTMSATINSHVVIGVSYSKAAGIRVMKSFKENGGTNSTISAEASLGVSAKLGITDLKVLSGYVSADAGITGRFIDSVYNDGKKPVNCRTFLAYMYANYGVQASCAFVKDQYKSTVEVFDLENSPIRVYRHYEDGSEVASCARGETLEYFTKHNSKYFGTGWSDGFGKYGFDGEGKPYQIFEYTLDSNYATITKYYGNMPYVVIPEKIDGYTVTAIGANAFENSESTIRVSIPDTVTQLKAESFAGCSNLQEVTLSKNLTSMDTNVFNNCSLLNNIEIPKSLETCNANDYAKWEGGPFNNCSGLKNVTFEKGIKKIPQRLFNCCTGLENVSIPYGVTDIEWRAFMNCKNLKQIDLPESITNIGCVAFSGCSMLKRVVLPEGLHKMGNDAFSYCSELEEVTIPKSLEEVYWDTGFHAHLGPFGNDDKLKTVHFNKGITKIVNSLFQDCSGIEEVELPSTVTSIYKSAFANCKNIRTINLNEGLECIDFGAFLNCTSLQNVDIPDSVVTMGVGDGYFDSGIFENCFSLSEVHIPTQSLKIPGKTFSGCSSLAKINFPETLKIIEDKAFKSCSSLIELNLPEQVSSIGTEAFSGCTNMGKVLLPKAMRTIGKEAFSGCISLTDLTFEEGTNSIGPSAFDGCKVLEKVNLPDTLQSLGSSAFSNCDELKEISLGAGIRELPEKIFFQDSSLTEIILPQQMTKVGAQAFANCASLTDITLNRNITTISDDVFSYLDKITIYGVKGTYPELYAKELGIQFRELTVPVKDLSLSHTSCKIGIDNSMYLTASILPVNSSDELVWISEDESIVTIDQAGLIKGVSTGTANIAAMIGDIVKTCEVTVYQPVSGVSLNTQAEDMGLNETFQLIATISPSNAAERTLIWSSSNDKVASVDQMGLVEALSFGTAEITVTTKDQSKSAVCKITVKPVGVTGIMLDKQDLTLKQGMTYQLEPKVLPSNAANKNILWQSSNPDIVSVDEGLLTAKEIGKSVIVAKTEDGGKMAVCNVVVEEKSGDLPDVTPDITPEPIATDLPISSELPASISTAKPEVTEAPGPIQNAGHSVTEPPVTESNSSVGNQANQKIYKSITTPKVRGLVLKRKKGRKIKCSWKKVSGARFYSVQIALNRKFTKQNRGLKVFGTQYTRYSLKKNKIYYVRVRAWQYISGQGFVAGKWSAVKKIKLVR